MKLRVMLTSAMTLAMLSNVSAEALGISGGTRGGYYARLATNLSELMRGLGHDAVTLESGGAKDNVNRVKANDAQVGFSQGDTLMGEGADGVEIIGTLGTECVHVVVRDGGEVGDEDDLQSDDGHAVAVGKQGSGSQTTWSYMVKLEPGYGASAAQFKGGTRALAALKTKQLDAVLFVTAPEVYTHKMVEAVNNDGDLEFIDIDDNDLNDDLPNGEPVYTFVEIDTSPKMGGGVDTICTPLLVIANAGLDERLLEDLSDQVLTNKAAILK